MDGARLRVAQALAVASRLTLKVGPCGEFACEVIWQDQETLGLRFLEDAAKVEKLQSHLLTRPESDLGFREETRVQVLWAGRLCSSAQESHCRVLNVSLVGVRAQVADPSGLVSPVTLRIDRFGEFSCEIVWRDGDCLGLQFLDDPETIERTIGEALPMIRRGSE